LHYVHGIVAVILLWSQDNGQEDRSRFHGCVVLEWEDNIQHEKKFPAGPLQQTLTFCFSRLNPVAMKKNCTVPQVLAISTIVVVNPVT